LPGFLPERLYAFEPDAPVREADRLARRHRRAERGSRMKEYSEKLKEMMEARGSMRGQGDGGGETAYDEWLVKDAPEPKDGHSHLEGAGPSGIAPRYGQVLVTPRQYANVRS
jgi:hypothetical protein